MPPAGARAPVIPVRLVPIFAVGDKPVLGRHVTVTGTLFPRETSYYLTDVVLLVGGITPR